MSADSVFARARARFGRRAVALGLALLIEGLLLLALLSLAPPFSPPKEVKMTTVSLDAVSEEAKEEPAPAPSEPSPPAAKPAEQPPVAQPPVPQPPAPVKASPLAPPPVVVQLSRDQMAAADISALPQRPAPSRSVMGPPDMRSSGDTPRVDGSGPNGEPLYAASWYREPYENELSGYLATASGPGWGLIACRTVPNYRVDDCVAVGEYPQGSNIARAVLAAAWQFRVRPPQLRGQPMVGEWVRIRIDYEMRRQGG